MLVVVTGEPLNLLVTVFTHVYTNFLRYSHILIMRCNSVSNTVFSNGVSSGSRNGSPCSLSSSCTCCWGGSTRSDSGVNGCGWEFNTSSANSLRGITHPLNLARCTWLTTMKAPTIPTSTNTSFSSGDIFSLQSWSGAALKEKTASLMVSSILAAAMSPPYAISLLDALPNHTCG